MNKNELEKNILDLKYKFQIEKIRASLTILTIGILAFISTFIWYLERLIFGIAISLLVILFSLFSYKKTKEKLKEIIKEIRNLNSK